MIIGTTESEGVFILRDVPDLQVRGRYEACWDDFGFVEVILLSMQEIPGVNKVYKALIEVIGDDNCPGSRSNPYLHGIVCKELRAGQFIGLQEIPEVV